MSGKPIDAEDIAVLLRLQAALPDVGLNGWFEGVRVLARVIEHLTAAQHPAASAPVGVEASYHPCTSILIEGLKRLEGGSDVLAEWDRARAKADTALAQQPAAGVVDDTRRIRALADNYWRLEPFDMPTPGGDDADVGWRVIEFHRAEPRERVVVEHYRDNPREAIDAALAAQHQEPKS